MDRLIDSLNEAQREAVTHEDGPLMILAGPGSGKTRVITHRLAYLVRQGASPRRMLALTFTNKAADEMQDRLNRLAGDQRIWMSTFHRFASRQLREHASYVGLESNFTIYDSGDSRRLLRRTIERLGLDLSHVSPDAIANEISRLKNRLVSPDDHRGRGGGFGLGGLIADIYPAYQKNLMAANAVDFDDLLMHLAILLRDNTDLRAALDERFEYVMVDEYQDTNYAQYAIVKALSTDLPNLAVTGDPDQSIYGWRGADLNNILDFERDYPSVRVVRLEQNYRSTQRILSAADHLIAFNKARKPKSLFTRKDQGNPICLVEYQSQREEAECIADLIAGSIESGRRRPRDFAVFYRMNALSRSIEAGLRDRGIPYQIVNGLEFFQRREIKDLVGYLKLVNNPRDEVAFDRVVNTPRRNIGKTTLRHLTNHAVRHGLTLLDAARESGMIESLSKRAAVSVARFVALYDRLVLHACGPIKKLLAQVLQETHYDEQFRESDDVQDEERLANIQELLSAAQEFDERNPEQGLEGFLEQASLVNDTDAWEDETDKVTLMTLHAAKGLEFPVVFIIALEEGVLPHRRSREDPRQEEEERRLLFVGMTRAEEELNLSSAKYRLHQGRRQRSAVSSFSFELPRDELQIFVNAAPSQPSWDEPRAPDEPVWEDEALEFPPPAAATRGDSAAPGANRLMTAADMLRSSHEASAGESPDAYYEGMTVLHPEFGPGKVMDLHGSGRHRCATVQFDAAGRTKSFVIANSQLVPLPQT